MDWNFRSVCKAKTFERNEIDACPPALLEGFRLQGVFFTPVPNRWRWLFLFFLFAVVLPLVLGQPHPITNRFESPATNGHFIDKTAAMRYNLFGKIVRRTLQTAPINRNLNGR